MRILFVGGPTDDPTAPPTFDWPTTCGVIGRQIATGGHELAVCSSYDKGADRWVLDGFVRGDGDAERLRVYTPARPEAVRRDWEDLLDQVGAARASIEVVDGPDAKLHRSNAYLLAQLRALGECQLVVTLGGNLKASATILLHMAESRGIPVLPYGLAGGAAEDARRRLRASLLQALQDDHGLLVHLDGIERCVELGERLRNPSRDRQPYVFVSHARKRPEPTDQVESVLRRHENVVVFRDETDIQPGADIPDDLTRALNECTHFVGLWCKEYACSPWCYDEFHTIMERRARDDSLKVLILRFDDTRFVWRPMRDEEHRKNWPSIEHRAQLQEILHRFVTDASE